MSPWWMLGRAALLLCAVWCALPLLRGASAGLRRGLLVLTFALCLVGPLLTWLMPEPRAGSPLALASAAPFAEPALAPASSSPAARALPATQARTLQVEELLLALWLVGSGLCLLRVANAHRKAAQLVKRATRHAQGLAISDELQVPVVAGALRPTILLPRAALAWDDARRAAALTHERAHVQGRDGLVQLGVQAVCALYWMVPFAWLLARRLHRECELAADERVIASGVSPTSYADTLLAVARGQLGVRRAATFSFVSELEERIRSLCAAPRQPWSRLRRGAVCLSVVGLALLLASVREVVSTAPALAHGAGTDARLSRIVDEEAERTRVEWAADDVVVVVLDPATGTVLSQLGRVGEARVPGSTIKPFVVATALEAEKVTLEQRFDTGGGARKYGTKVLEDYAVHPSLDLRELLMVSSNVGASRVYDALGGAALLRGLSRLHLGDAPGARPQRLVDGSYEGAVVASGEGMRVTPLELAAAYGSLVDGTYRAPSFTSRSESTENVLRPETARTVRKMLESVVHDPRGTGGKAALPGVRVAGKTGTSNLHEGSGPVRTFASFAGLVPAEAPRFVVYVGVVTARAGATGGKVAAPLFARIAARALAP